jgi:hypothetical protein
MRGPSVSALLVLLAAAPLASAQPVNDDCANATVITSFPFVDTVDTTTATAEAGEPSDCGGGDNGVWYRIPAETAETLFWASTAGSISPEFAVTQFTGSCGALTSFACELSDNFSPELGIAPLGQDVLVRVNSDISGGTLALGVKRLPEFLVAYPAGVEASVAGGPNGCLVAVPADPGIAGRSFDTNGTPLGPPFAVTNDGYYRDVAAAGTGSFVVVWEGSTGIEAARVDGPGAVVALPVAVAGGFSPAVAADADGDFVVVWGATDGSSSGVFAQRFDADGAAQGAAFQVNTYTTGSQNEAAVAMAPGGGFVVTWSGQDGSSYGVKARLFDATGAPLGGEFVVNTYTTGNQNFSVVGMDAAGNFVVAWEGGDESGNISDPITARRFTAAGAPLGGEFIVNTTPEYYPTNDPRIAVAPTGDFVVTWETFVDFAGVHDAWVAGAARRFDSDGTPAGPEFFVNTLVGTYGYDPDVGVAADGSFMVVWGDYKNFFDGNDHPEGSSQAVVGRVLPEAQSPCAPVPLSGCRQSTVPSKSKLLLVDDPDPLHDAIRWTWPKGEATDVAAFGDPLASDGYLLCLYDGSAELIFDATAPAGGTCGTKPCWKGTGTPPGATGFRYKDKERTPEGVLKLVLKAGIEGKAKVVMKGGGPNLSAGALGLPPLPLVFPARLQLQGPGGECWEAVFGPSGVTTNVPGEFAGKAG